MNYKLHLFLLIVMGLSSCKDDCPDPPVEEEPYDIEVEQFYILQGGNTQNGICGDALLVSDKALTYLDYYKPIDVPEGMTTSFTYKYKGKLRIFPAKHSCSDGWGDPKPGEPPRTIIMHMVTVLEWEPL